MKAAVIERYGSPDVVQIRDVPRPEPSAGEILIRVHAATVNRTDCGELRPHPAFARLVFGLRRPRRKIFGMDVAGVVEAVGAEVKSFNPGDRVFGMCPFRRNGAHAEYVLVPESAPIAGMPANTGFDEAVVCEGAYYANAGLEQFNVGPGDRILVYGASGAIGSAAVQLAKSRGAEVTAVVPTGCMEMARSLGADRVIDYTVEDFTRAGNDYGYVLDAVGKVSFFRCRKLLAPGGRFMATDVGPWALNLPLILWSMVARNGRVVVPLPRQGSAGAFVTYLRGLMEERRFRAVIDRKYPLNRIADAYRYVESGQKVGIVVILLAAENAKTPCGPARRDGAWP